MRPRKSAIVFSSSFQLATSMPASRAAVLLAKSQAICTCRLKGNMSGAKREDKSTVGSSFLAPAKVSALASTADVAPRPCTKGGTATWYMERVIGNLLFCSGLWLRPQALSTRQIVRILQVAQAHPPFDRSIVKPEGRTINLKQGRAGGKVQDVRGLGVRRGRRQA